MITYNYGGARTDANCCVPHRINYIRSQSAKRYTASPRIKPQLQSLHKDGRPLTFRVEASQSSLFPAGRRQTTVRIPALHLFVTVDEVLSASSSTTLQTLSDSIQGGVTAIILQEAGAGSGSLYLAGIKLSECIRGRASLLIEDRTDIVDASGADGALLTGEGLPVVIVKRMLQDRSSLVGRRAQDAVTAITAAEEGANFIILEKNMGEEVIDAPLLADARQQRSGSSSVPIIAFIPEATDFESLQSLIAAGIDGIACTISSLKTLASRMSGTEFLESATAAKSLMATLGKVSSDVQSQTSAQLSNLLTEIAVDPQSDSSSIINEEKDLLSQILAFLEGACSQLEEMSLLQDALTQLDEPFLLVVVGEFNSGKTAVINALLGEKLLAEGILPTTNEINVLKYGDQSETEEDGLTVRNLPVPLLKTLSIVDTPGTNVILERQQRLTEEYVPRADLILFVMSADRPLTESEVTFLKYIRKWGKKVVFVINKVDILANTVEAQEVAEFVKNNAMRLLGVDNPRVLTVSARGAMEAKLKASNLSRSATWSNSQFETLEQFIYDYLVGSGDKRLPGERARLKLQTPLFIADALLGAAKQVLANELEVAQQDSSTIALVKCQLADYRREMEREGMVQRQEVDAIVGSSVKRVASVVDSTLQLSNVEAVTSYLFGKGDSTALPVAKRLREDAGAGGEDAASALRGLIREYNSWVVGNCRRQLDNYREFAERRAVALGKTLETLMLGSNKTDFVSDPEARRKWREARDAATAEELALATAAVETFTPQSPSTNSTGDALMLASGLDPTASAAMLEEEVRTAVLGTAGTAAGAGAFGVVLTTVLPTTLEDLLALALAGAIGYASVLSLPLRRAEAKRKLEQAAQKTAQEVQTAMKSDLSMALSKLEEEVGNMVSPLEALAGAEIASIEAAQKKCMSLSAALEALKLKVAAVE